jgi:ribonuclease HI
MSDIITFFNPKQCNIHTESTIVPDYYVYTDGACSNNGRSNAIAGIGIFFGNNDPRNVSKRIEGKQTNNTAEMLAIIDTYEIIEQDIIEGKKVAIVSDSEYALKCVQSYGKKCSDNGWQKDIPNKELVKIAYNLYQKQSNIVFIHCRAHTNQNDIHSIGNDGADRLANMSIGLESCPYSNSKIYLEVPYAKKDEVKGMGGKWDPTKKKWYINDNNPNKETLLELYKT